MAPYEAFYGRRCRSFIGWFEVGEQRLIGHDLIHNMEKVEVIQEIENSESLPKSYSYFRRKSLVFEVDDWADGKCHP